MVTVDTDRGCLKHRELLFLTTCHNACLGVNSEDNRSSVNIYNCSKLHMYGYPTVNSQKNYVTLNGQNNYVIVNSHNNYVTVNNHNNHVTVDSHNSYATANSHNNYVTVNSSNVTVNSPTIMSL